MPRLSTSAYAKLHGSFDLPVAHHLAGIAMARRTMTYGELAEIFGGIARGYGNILSGIAIRCHEQGLPMLSVLVVNAETGLPSVDADLYAHLGLSPELVKAEQVKCFEYDWSKTPLGR